MISYLKIFLILNRPSKIIANHITEYNFKIEIDALEVLINQIINTETIDFKGEPLRGFAGNGLLESTFIEFQKYHFIVCK